MTGVHEVWEDGQAFRDLQGRLKTLAENRTSIEAARKVCTTQSYRQVLCLLTGAWPKRLMTQRQCISPTNVQLCMLC